MRIRTVKPGFFLNAELYDAEIETGLPIRLAYIGLWCVADREGRFRWRPRELKVQIFPHDDLDFSRVLHACLTRGWVEKYASQGEEFGWIPSFKRHQVINNRESDSVLPDPCDSTTSTRAPRVPHACPTPLVHAQGEGKGKEGKGREHTCDHVIASDSTSPALPLLPSTSPNGDSGARPEKREQKPKMPRPRNVAFDALVSATGGNPEQVTPAEGGRVAKALADIRSVCPSLSPEDLADEIHRRAGIYRRSHPDWSLTPTALASHWSGSDAPTALPGAKKSKTAVQAAIDDAYALIAQQSR